MAWKNNHDLNESLKPGFPEREQGEKNKPAGKTRVKTGRNILVAGGVVGLVGWGAWVVGQKRFSPKIEGKFNLHGLKSPVEVIRDKWGVPHLFAENMDDLLYGQGFVQAQDRFWQMEFQRRLAAGRLSEVLGEPALAADKVMRRFNLMHYVKQDYEVLSAEERGLLASYCQGVNAFLGLNKLPLEFTFLRYKPEEWGPLDCLLWSKVMAIGQSGNLEAELLRALLVQKVGPEIAARLEPFETSGLPLILPVGADYRGVNFEEIIEEFSRLHELTGMAGAGNGSNNWVVDGGKSATGKPLLANDPHISPSMPAIWYEMHLQAGDFEVAGVTLPGVPMVVLGHNRHIAWGVTNTMADYQDGFIEKLDGKNPGSYEYKGEWLEFEKREEIIKVKNKPSFKIDYFKTVHGLVMSDFKPDLTGNGQGRPLGKPVAVSWTLFEPSASFRSILRLNRAKNWEEFREGLKDWNIPSLSFVYADREGNIGFQYAGQIPLRRKGKGMLPVPGHTGEFDWNGYIPFEELPTILNPETHYILTANNQVAGEDYPYHLSSEYLGGWRAKRIKTLLTAKEKLSREDFRQIQTDQFSEPGFIFAGLIQKVAAQTNLQRQALEYFRAWDGNLGPSSVPGALYKMTIYKLLRRLLIPLLGEPLAEKFMGVGEGLAPLNVFSGLPGPMVIRLIEKNDTWLLKEGRTWAEELAGALDEALEELQNRLGQDMAKWEWGKLHTMKYSHPLGAVTPLDRIFNRGPQPIGGDTDTVWQTGYSGKDADFTANGPTASFRDIYDLGDFDNSLIGIMAGQSGSPFSRHYFDQGEAWIEGQLHPMLFNRSDLALHTSGTLLLNPVN